MSAEPADSVGASLPGAAHKSRVAAFRAEWEIFRHAPFGAPVGFVERLLAALEANAPDPFVLVGMEGRDDDEAHEAMLTADCAAWLAENPREYSFSTTKLAKKLVRLGWRAMWRGAALEAGPYRGDAMFHRLWTKYAALPEYVKSEWTAAFNEVWGVRGESLPSDEKIAPRLPDTFVERAIQVARANPGEPDVFVMLTVFEAAYIREKYVERNAPRTPGNDLGGPSRGEEP